ncbi:capsular exopolysaccharide synthesis family protein [Knoellia remsis]|uniref:non-specific protein-tyrosine kinase n=1 Tax=Knoellia remsis TaxID=407159 RepID=A0A2T0UZ65_9MICO|nr:polysaccharide biosynthesis tyrosine autokinase [Knoellia remsis]PRY63206.1 capsular exopolysaccharide synthesis family protein [Knoellia remsis]
MTFLDFVRLSRANLLRIVLLVLIGAGLAFAYAQTLPKVYAADASGYVVTGGGQNTGDVFAGSTLAGSKAESYLPLINSRAVGKRAGEIIGSDAPPEVLAARVAGSVAPGSVILKINATGPTPTDARDLADATMEAVAAEANRLELGGGEVKPGTQALVRIIPIETALLPGAPIGPNVTKYVLAGAVAGAALAYAWIFIRRLSDTRIRTSKDVEDLTGSSSLGVIPLSNELRKARGGRSSGLGLAGESFRQIRTNLRFVSPDAPPQSIVVTSASPSEGKSTVSSTLASIIAEDGRPVVIIDADLRRPNIANILEVSSTVGLSEVLSGQMDYTDAMQATRHQDVFVIAGGQVPPNPSELLGSARMRQLLQELTRDHFVILDAPPLLPVTDAALLSGAADGTILVFAVGKTHKDQVEACAKMIQQVGGRILGIVLNMAPKRGMGSVMYGDGYSTYYSHGSYEYYKSGPKKGRRRAAKKAKDRVGAGRRG